MQQSGGSAKPQVRSVIRMIARRGSSGYRDAGFHGGRDLIAVQSGCPALRWEYVRQVLVCDLDLPLLPADTWQAEHGQASSGGRCARVVERWQPRPVGARNKKPRTRKFAAPAQGGRRSGLCREESPRLGGHFWVPVTGVGLFRAAVQTTTKTSTLFGRPDPVDAAVATSGRLCPFALTLHRTNRWSIAPHRTGER